MGGLVTSLFAEKWDQVFPITIHSIAAPLAGMEHQLLSGCEKIARKEYYISSTVTYTQWKTVHSQDGAFQKLKIWYRANRGEIFIKIFHFRQLIISLFFKPS